MWSTWRIFAAEVKCRECQSDRRGQISREGRMPVGIMTSRAEKSDRAPPIGVSLLSFLRYSSQNWRKYVSVWVLELGWLAPGSIWSWTFLQLAATQMDRQFLLDLEHELSGELAAVFAFCADSSRVTDNQENLIQQQHFLSPDNRMRSPVEEGRNQRMVGNWWTLPQVVEGEGSPLGWTQRNKNSLLNTSSFYPTFKLSEQALYNWIKTQYNLVLSFI